MVYFQSNLYVHPIQNKLDVYLQVFLFLLILNTHFGVLVHVWSALENPVINKVILPTDMQHHSIQTTRPMRVNNMYLVFNALFSITANSVNLSLRFWVRLQSSSFSCKASRQNMARGTVICMEAISLFSFVKLSIFYKWKIINLLFFLKVHG